MQPNFERDVTAELAAAEAAGAFSIDPIELGYMDDEDEEADVSSPTEGDAGSSGGIIGGFDASQSHEDLSDSFGRPTQTLSPLLQQQPPPRNGEHVSSGYESGNAN